MDPVTGSSSGLGLDITRHVLSKGDIAVATLRKPEVLDELIAEYPKERLLVLKVDVTVHQDILDAFKKTKEVFGRIDVVVSNAGTGLLSEVEGTPDDVARALFDVNFWGSVHVLQEAVRFLRDENAPGKGGRVFQITSGMELVGFPGCGFYSATKHAISGLAQSLAKEVDPAWNIKLTIIALGAFGTNAVNAMDKLPVHPAYDNPDLAVAKWRKAVIRSQSGDFDPALTIKGDAAKAAEAIYRLSEEAAPPLRIPLGCVDLARGATKDLSDEVEKWASCSVGLDKDEYQN
ncbi:NAD(P)-binding protein [Dichomitus squalens]|uniref:NAD(P)-binding protein n=1 Tax=Dichomitus squalens TaxID=114155 RepID=A0A4Q9P098_9APHY|nr:NAD(P)-binding protein [Dichomitus squalens]TBU60342.1 NAD(P)-binding protein [Dichomitus squalens]